MAVQVLDTHNYDATQTSFPETYIMSIKDDETTNLRRAVLENSTKETEETSSDEVLTSLSMVLGSSDGAAAGINPLEEMEVEETLEKISERVIVDEDEHRPLTVVSNNNKKRKHTAMSDDPWISGSEQLSKKDVIYNRGEVVR